VQNDVDAALFSCVCVAVAAGVFDFAQGFCAVFVPEFFKVFFFLLEPFAVAFGFAGSNFESDKRVIVDCYAPAEYLLVHCINFYLSRCWLFTILLIYSLTFSLYIMEKTAISPGATNINHAATKPQLSIQSQSIPQPA
jgi:hypothetical protein